ncbi:hypothetical protein ABZX51_009573 [Aspergillus tubingensis]
MTDAGGLFGFARLVSVAMWGEQFSDSLLEQVNRDRHSLIPLSSPGEPILDHSHHTRLPITDAQPVVRPDQPSGIFLRFTAANMAELKVVASQSMTPDPYVPYSTTDDAELVDLPLGEAARHMRRELNRANTAYHVWSFATFITQKPDESTIAVGASTQTRTWDPHRCYAWICSRCLESSGDLTFLASNFSVCCTFLRRILVETVTC